MKNREVYEENDLFRGDDETWTLNACVGRNGGPYDFHDYARGYMSAGIKLAEMAGSTDLPVDSAIYPIAFCFRHAIELYLKHLSTKLAYCCDDIPKTRLTHKLLDNWDVIYTYIKLYPKLFDINDLSQATTIIKDFVAIDSSGEVFRFPYNRAKRAHLQNSRLINVLVLRSAMRTLYDILDQWSYTCEEILDYKRAYRG